MQSISGKRGITISTFAIIRSLRRSCAIFIAIRGPQRARFWLAGVEAGEGWVVRTSGGLGVEQFSPLRNRLSATGGDRVRMDGPKTRTRGGKTLSSGRTDPLKPKDGLNGPPADADNISNCGLRCPWCAAHGSHPFRT